MHLELSRSVHARIPTTEGEFHLYHYGSSTDGKEHVALVYGEVAGMQDLLVRVHSECFTGDVLGSLRCDCGPQLDKAMEMIAQAGCGAVLYLRQEGRGIGLAEKLRAYNLQDEGYDTVEANLMLGHQADERRYQPAAAILADLGVGSIRLLTNNPEKIEGLTALGITVSQRVPLETDIHVENSGYLQTKVTRMRHMLNLTNGHSPRATAHATGQDNHSTANFSTTGHISVDEQLDLLCQRIARHCTHHSLSERPFITVSYAQSLDGSITAKRGQPTVISGSESMTITHAIRTCHDAILVGIDTILADDPRLNVRLVQGKSPTPIVLDSQLRMPPAARIFDAHDRVIIATTQPADCDTTDHSAICENKAALQKRGAVVVHLVADRHNRVDLNSLFGALSEMGIKSVMVEGGSSVLTSFLTAQLPDYLAVTIAPTYISGLNVMQNPEVPSTRDGTPEPRPPQLPQLCNPSWTPVGSDMILWGQPCAKA